MRVHVNRAMKAVTASAAVVATLLPAAAATAATPSYPDDAKPDITSLLGEFYNWWAPQKIADSSNLDPTDATSNRPEGAAFRGDVTDEGKTILKANDDKTVAVNHKAASDTAKVDGTHTQAQRAAIDATDDDAFRQYKEVFGSTIAGYISDGLTQGKLPKLNELIFNDDSDLSVTKFGTVSAKTDFNYIRPYADESIDGWDRTFGGDNNLNGLAPNLGIKRIPMFTENGIKFGEDYTDINDQHDGKPSASADFKPSQSFPSGHTAKAYNLGINLATLLPELGPELLTRASEAGNNRIVLGVHYPLDVIGSRISASADATALWSDQSFRTSELEPAHEELENYVAARCKADGLGDTVEACVGKTGANADKGYTNSFTDDVASTEPVTDRASAIDVYTSRMTYGFNPTSASGQAAKVPDGAANLLLTAFPDLSDAQRTQVLKASEIGSGYPLDKSSEGFQRINLAKAFSANVSLSEDGKTIIAITFGNDAPTVTKVTSKDAITSLLTDFTKYWQPGIGVTAAGVTVFRHDDGLTESINHKASNTAQDDRAVSDAQMNSTNTLYDALGPVLGAYYKQGITSGSLPKTEAFLKTANGSANSGNAKAFYQHPRPHVDRINYVGTTLNLRGLRQTLDITRVPAYEDFDWGDGEPRDNEYEGLYNSGSFPSGHTTFAFTQGAGLATILPELGTQIITRVSEAGNNRIVLGVHYPLDILGSHIAGQYGVAMALDDAQTKQEATAARTELVTYLAKQCKKDGHGSTLAACISSTGANSKNGYQNSFTDDVVTQPVKDVASAVKAYTSRMVYGFSRTGAAGQSPVVPAAAVNLVRNVPGFVSLSDSQLKQVIAKTEIDSGYPLDASSQGWARVNLAAVYSSKVTLDQKGNVKKVQPGQPIASVVTEHPAAPAKTGNGGKAAAGNLAGSTTGSTSGQSLAHTGTTVTAVMLGAIALLVSGGAALAMSRKHHGVGE